MAIMPKIALQRLIDHTDFTHEEMLEIMQQIMSGEFTQIQIAGFLSALRVKGETVTEIAAAAQVMRELSSKVVIDDTRHLIDTCGTGGAPNKVFNVSTASAFVAAGAGAKIAKHGGRAASSKSGSADVLEALGVPMTLSPQAVARFPGWIAPLGAGGIATSSAAAQTVFQIQPLPAPGKGRLSRLSRTFPIQPTVDLRPDERGQYYLLSVAANDRTGLLYSIANVLTKYKINLHTAKVMTLGERVEDVFLIDGAALSNARNQIQLETDLLDAIKV